MSASFRMAIAVVERVAADEGFDSAALLGRGCTKTVRRARRRAMFALRDELDLSFPEIGLMFGLEHTTARYGVLRAREDMGLVEERAA